MKKVLLISLTLLAIGLFSTQTGFTYENINQGCLSLTCHPPGAVGTATPPQLHGIADHTANCANCHPGGTPGNNVLASTCAGCHPRTGDKGVCPLIAAVPSHGSACLACHASGPPTPCAPENTTTTVPATTTTTTTPPTNSCAITISPKAATVAPGATIQFSAASNTAGLPQTCVTPCYSWSVSGESGATITQDGLYTAGNTLGKDTVTITDGCNDVSATAEITVGNNDADGDGVPDDADNCPESNLDETIIIGKCDSGVINQRFEDGCTMSDLIAGCGIGARNHIKNIRCVAHLTNEWKAEGLISGEQKGAIQRCVAKYKKHKEDDNGDDEGNGKGKGKVKGKVKDGKDHDEDDDEDND